MKIIKILNNNVVVSEHHHDEVIVMGRGLAFGRKIGDDLPQEAIEKTYVLSDTNAEELRDFLAHIPAEMIELADRTLSYAKQYLKAELKDQYLVTFADHLSGVRDRALEGLQLRNFLL